MLIKIPRDWQIKESEVTPEHLYFNRREFLKSTAGILAFSLIGGCSDHPEENVTAPIVPEAADPTSDLYPTRKNEKYKLDRPLSIEEIAATYNNYYEFTEQKDVFKHIDNFVIRPWTVTVSGLVKKPKTFDIDELIRKFPLEERLYRHRCVEAWSMAVPWTGFPLAELIRLVEPSSTAKYIRLVSFLKPEEAPGQKRSSRYHWPYYEGLTIGEAMNELAFLVTGIYGHPLPVQHGAPLRLAVPWKYGYKSIKGITQIEFVDSQPGTFWNDLQPLEYGFTSNVNPEVPHPRWSQATERLIDTGERVPTRLYNGYGEFVSSLYPSE